MSETAAFHESLQTSTSTTHTAIREPRLRPVVQERGEHPTKSTLTGNVTARAFPRLERAAQIGRNSHPEPSRRHGCSNSAGMGFLVSLQVVLARKAASTELACEPVDPDLWMSLVVAS
jgi:hypothetical protein